MSEAIISKSFDVIRNPIITEKSTLLSEHNKYVFSVLPDSNKLDIRRAIEKIFSVTVTSVRVMNVKGKVKRFKGRKGFTKGYKKAIITLKEGDVIDYEIGIK